MSESDFEDDSTDGGPATTDREHKQLFSKKLKNVKPGRNTVSRKLAAFWKSEIELVDKNNSKWVKRGKTVIKRYRDERSRVDEDQQRRMNLLWTNTKIMVPALLGKCPQAIAERKHMDQDKVGRLSSQILERGLRTQVEDHGYYIALRAALLDYLLPGRGIVWLRYEPEIGQSDSLVSSSNAFADLDKIEEEYNLKVDDAEEDQLEGTGEEIIAEKVPVDYLNWEDFYMFPATARTWEEVQAIGKRVYISKAEAIERFGEEIGEAIKPDTTPAGSDKSRSPFADSIVLADINARDLVIFEIWNKTDRRVYWTSPGYDFLCDVRNDPLKLNRFFPVPRPLASTMTNDTIVPIPDFMEWQDQALQIDELTQRLAMLTKACKVAGTYDAANAGLKRLMDESVENQLIPVDSWAAFGDKGGLPGSISFLPIKEIQEVIQTLTEVRKEIKIDLDEVTGMSDVLRGTSDSRETLGGLRIKNNNAGTRLQDKQNEVAHFAKEVIAIMAEIMCKHFSDETLIECSGIKFASELQPEEVLADFQSEMWQKLNMKLNSMQGFGGGGGPPNQGNQSPAPPPQGASPPSMPGAASHPGLPMQQGPQQPPQGQPGTNIVPFQRPGMPQQPQQPQQPPQDPQQVIMQLMQMAMQQVTPEELIKKKIDAAIKLLREEITRNYRIDIETDSTIFGDAQQERQDATELITGVTAFLGQAETLTANLPEAIPLMGKLLQWGFRKFRVGRDLESAVDDFVRKAEKKSVELMNHKGGDPEAQKAQAEIQKIQMQTQGQQASLKIKQQMDMQKAAAQDQNDQRDFQRQQANDMREQQMEEMKAKREMAVEGMKIQLEEKKMGMETQKMGMEMHANHQEHQLGMQHMQSEHQMHQQDLQHQSAMEQKSHGLEMEKMQGQAKVDKQGHSQTMEHMQASHKQKMQAAKTPKGKPKVTK